MTPAPGVVGPAKDKAPQLPANEPMEPANEPMPRKYRYQGDDGSEVEATLDDLLKDYKRKVKVGEEEVELSLDEMDKGYLRRDFFDRKVSEAHKAIREAEQLRKLIDERPVDLIRHLNGNDQEKIIALARELVAPYARRAEMTPEQREVDEAREQLAREREEIKQWRAQQEEAQKQERLNRAGPIIDSQIATAFEQNGLDPSDEVLVARVATLRLWAKEHGLPYSIADISRDIAQKENARVEAKAKALEAERLKKLEQNPMQQAMTQAKPKPQQNGTEEKKRPWLSPDEYAELRNKRFE